MKTRTIVLLTAAAVAVTAIVIAFGCGKSLDELTAADPEQPCGRYCLKCSACVDTGTDTWVKQALDYTCAIDEVGIACQELCEQGSALTGVNVEQNVLDIEAQKGKLLTDESFTCDDFAFGVATGDLDSPCSRFCRKCVECANRAGQASVVNWCAEQDGIPCTLACEEQFESYVVDFEAIAKEETPEIQTISDINCDNFDETAQKAGLDTSWL